MPTALGLSRWTRMLSGVLVTTLVSIGAAGWPSGAAAQDTDQLTSSELAEAGVAADIAGRLTVDSDPSRMSVSFTVDGVLVAEDRAPIADETIQVGLDPSPAALFETLNAGGRAAMIPLAVDQTDNAGQFRLGVPALRNISSYISDDGEAQLVFTSFGPSHSLLFRVEVELPTRPGGIARAAIADERIIDATTVATANATPDGPAPVPLTELTLTATGGSSDSASTQDVVPYEECARVDPGGQPPTAYAWAQPQPNDQAHPYLSRGFVLLQKLWTEDHTTAVFDWDNSLETRITTAADFAYKGEVVKGGFSRSMQELTNLGKTFSVGENEQRWAEAEWVFMWAELWCNYYGEWYRPFVFEFRPAYPTGGDRFNLGFALACGGPQWTTTINVPTRFGAGTTTIVTRSISAYGASLDLAQTQTDLHKLEITPVDGPAQICGFDNFPAQTSWVKEVVPEDAASRDR